MSKKLARADLYVAARLRGEGAREAARSAGYVHGVPAAGARELWLMASALREIPEIDQAATAESMKIARVKAKVAGAARAARLWQRARERLTDQQVEAGDDEV